MDTYRVIRAGQETASIGGTPPAGAPPTTRGYNHAIASHDTAAIDAGSDPADPVRFQTEGEPP